MALYERRVGEQLYRTFTEDGSQRDAEMAAKVATGQEGWRRADETPAAPPAPARQPRSRKTRKED